MGNLAKGSPFIKKLIFFCFLLDTSRYSSLNHIREMPLDIIKIDKCFIEHLGEDDFSDAFVKMVTELANTIGVHVCVEGVETDRQYAIIKKMGIYYIQGYFFDKPMCIESFEEKYI